jgi:hypothetical protein
MWTWILPQKFICPSVFIVLYFFFGPCVLYFHTFVSMLILGGKRNQNKGKRRGKRLRFLDVKRVTKFLEQINLFFVL